MQTNLFCAPIDKELIIWLKSGESICAVNKGRISNNFWDTQGCKWISNTGKNIRHDHISSWGYIPDMPSGYYTF